MTEENEDTNQEEVEGAEKSYAQDLRKARLESEMELQDAELAGASEVEAEGAPEDNSGSLPALIMQFLLSSADDGLDILQVGAIPIVGDVLDVGTGGFNILIALMIKDKRQRNWAIGLMIGATAFELLPLGVNDYIPTYMLVTIASAFIKAKAKGVI